MLPDGRREKCSFPPAPRPPAESRDQTGKEQSWWPTICLEGAFWSFCKYDYRADPEPVVAFESCQFPIRFWQTLLEFGFDRSKPPLAYQCPPPLTPSTKPQPQAPTVILRGCKNQQSLHQSGTVGRWILLLLLSIYLWSRRERQLAMWGTQ